MSLGELTPTKPADETADLTVGTAGTSIAGMLCEAASPSIWPVSRTNPA